MPGAPANTYVRHKCPICGARFMYGVTSFHYQAAHPEYSVRSSLWLKILFVLFVPMVTVVLLLTDWLAPGLAKNTIFVGSLLLYTLGGLASMVDYRLVAERGFRKQWNDPSEEDGKLQAREQLKTAGRGITVLVLRSNQ